MGRGCVHACVQVCTRPAGPHNPSFLSSQWTRVASGASSTSAPTTPPFRLLNPSQDTGSQRPRLPKASAPGPGGKGPVVEFQAPGRISAYWRVLPALHPVPGSSPTGGRTWISIPQSPSVLGSGINALMEESQAWAREVWASSPCIPDPVHVARPAGRTDILEDYCLSEIHTEPGICILT